jgi:hypothetical protein
MATSRHRLACAASLAALGLGLVGAGCGSNAGKPGGSGTSGAASSTPGGARTTSAGAGTAAAWLRSSPAPAGWPAINIGSGGRMVYPPTWHRIRGDAGTASAALTTARGRFVGYLNLTPQQGKETLANFPAFRLDHNHDEGDRQIHRLAAATNLAFPAGRGSCVKDEYRTGTGAHYIELACIVSGQRTTAVIVGAAPPAEWPQVGGDIARAVLGVGV